ncbi:MAG: extracellular solute-binding protein [Endozoicomonas sp.]
MHHPLLTLLYLIVAISPLFGQAKDCEQNNPQIIKSHGIARFDDLKYSQDFLHFDYVNPSAPKGGRVRLFAHGTFDSVNPYAISGITPSTLPSYSYMRYGFSEFNETLMVGYGSYAPSGDEARSVYGLIARDVEYPQDNSWILFNLRPEARFHDGHPITSKDVVFSFNELREKGHPRYRMQLGEVVSVTALSIHKVRFDFRNPGDRSQLFRVAELPVLPAHYWEGKGLGKTTLTPILGSGPYKVTAVEPGAFVTLSRVQDYWGKDLPVNKGKYNFDTVTVYFHRDLHAAFESFKAGGHDIHPEVIAKNWETAYNFPAMQSGQVKRRVIPHKMAYGSSFFFFNLRRSVFKDVRVREALSIMFDFEWTNRVIFHNAYKRSSSYFPNTPFQGADSPAKQELTTLEPLKKLIPVNLMTEPFVLAEHSGNGSDRQPRTKALALLRGAGWRLNKNQMTNSDGQPLSFEFISRSSGTDRYILPFRQQLKSIGVDMKYKVLDASQYYQRIQSRDFDMLEQVLPQTLSPGRELAGYFHSDSATENASGNLPGISNPAVDAILKQLESVSSQQELITLLKNLDRILLWNHYGIPKWYSDFMRIAYRDIFAWPETQPAYTTSFTTWWMKEAPRSLTENRQVSLKSRKNGQIFR